MLSTEPTGSSAWWALSLGCAGGHRQTRLGCQQQAVWMFRGQAPRLRDQLWWVYGVQGFASSFLPIGKAWGKKNVEVKALGKGTWVGLNLKKKNYYWCIVGRYFFHAHPKGILKKNPRIQNLKQSKSFLICWFWIFFYYYFFKLGWKRVNKVFLQRVDPSHATQCWLHKLFRHLKEGDIDVIICVPHWWCV